MQSTGHTSTHERSFTLMHGSAMMYVIPALQRSEEHTSELQSRLHLVCRLLLEKKNTLALIKVAARRYYPHVLRSASPGARNTSRAPINGLRTRRDTTYASYPRPHRTARRSLTA